MGGDWLATLLDAGAAVIGPFGDGALLEEVGSDAADLVGRFREGDRSDRFWHFFDGSGDVLYRVHGLEAGTGRGAISRLQRHDALLGAASQALMVDEPVPTVAALIVKEPRRGAAVPWHQDRPEAGERTGVNLTVYLHGSDRDNGCVTFVPGSHRLRSPVDAEDISVRAAGVGGLRDLVVRPGEVSVHDVRLVHASGPNSSIRPRLAVVLEYASPGVTFDDDRGC